MGVQASAGGSAVEEGGKDGLQPVSAASSRRPVSELSFHTDDSEDGLLPGRKGRGRRATNTEASDGGCFFRPLGLRSWAAPANTGVDLDDLLSSIGCNQEKPLCWDCRQHCVPEHCVPEDDCVIPRSCAVGITPIDRHVTIVVMQHGECEEEDPLEGRVAVEGRSELYQHDPLLSEKGRAQAVTAARAVYEATSTQFALVTSSPYLSCVATAVEICRTLCLPLCIDEQLGQVYGPSHFGPCVEGPKRRPQEEVLGTLPPGVRLVADIGSGGCVGSPPRWGETVPEARLRLIARVEQYASGAGKEGGIIVVTHAHGVEACLELALGGKEAVIHSPSVDKVFSCGYVILERDLDPLECEEEIIDIDENWDVDYGNVMVCATAPSPRACNAGSDRPAGFEGVEQHSYKERPRSRNGELPPFEPEEDP